MDVGITASEVLVWYHKRLLERPGPSFLAVDASGFLPNGKGQASGLPYPVERAGSLGLMISSLLQDLQD